jgi:hypothetical protein
VPNAAGRYYFEQIREQPPDHGFDADVTPVREGRKEYAMMKNGRRVVLQDLRRALVGIHEAGWRLLQDGTQGVHHTASNHQHILSPWRKAELRYGRVHPEHSDQFGCHHLSRTFSITQSRSFRRRVHDWISTLERDSKGRYVLAEEYYKESVLQEDRLGEMKFDEEGVRTADNEVAVKATLDRPLRGKPLVYMGTEMASPEAFEDTRALCGHAVLEARHERRKACLRLI